MAAGDNDVSIYYSFSRSLRPYRRRAALPQLGKLEAPSCLYILSLADSDPGYFEARASRPGVRQHNKLLRYLPATRRSPAASGCPGLARARPA
jgi:hypothetical protein